MYSDPSLSHWPDPERQSGFYSGVPFKRGLAWIIDFIIIFILMIPVLIFTAFLAVFIWPLAFAAVGFIYRVVTLGNGSATLGMRMMAIEFRDVNGHRFDTNLAFLHTAGYTVLLMAFPVHIISVITMFITPHGQSLVDKFLGTVALNKRA